MMATVMKSSHQDQISSGMIIGNRQFLNPNKMKSGFYEKSLPYVFYV